MSPLIVGLIGFGILFVLMFLGTPIAFAMGLVGFAGFVYLRDFESGLGLLTAVPYSTFASYPLSVVPLFILMGAFCFHAGLSRDLYETVYKWLGQLRGGLAMATVGACAGFAAVSGSSLATAATMGTVALPEMKRFKYDPALATGCIAAGGTIGILIPPSVILIIYGIIAEQSIGKLFLAGFIPGILEAVFYMVTIYIICKRNPLLGPPGPMTSLKEKILSLKNTWIVLLLFVVVLGGLYLGVFTPTEAGGIGAFGAFIFALGRRKLGWQALQDSVLETTKTTAMIFLILLGAMILGYFLAVSRLPFELADFIGGLLLNRYIILGIILVVYLFLGCVMSALAMIMLTVPIFFPVIIAIGFDPIWFGIIIVRVVEMASITPPVGLNVFVIRGALLVAVPQIALFLPGMMK